MKKAFVVMVLALAAFSFQCVFAEVTQEQEKRISLLTDDELYDVFVDVMFKQLEQQYGMKFVGSNGEKIKKCYLDVLKSTFNAKEMRIIYVQPDSINSDYYKEKMKSMTPQVQKACFSYNN